MPFGDFKDFADCVSKNKDKDSPEGYCALIHKKITGKYPAEEGLKFDYRDSLAYLHKILVSKKIKLTENN